MKLGVFNDIIGERKRQDDKWGEQNHGDFVWLAVATEELGEVAQAMLHDEFGGDHAGTVRTELVQLAAVVVQWIECIDRSARKCLRCEGTGVSFDGHTCTFCLGTGRKAAVDE